MIYARIIDFDLVVFVEDNQNNKEQSLMNKLMYNFVAATKRKKSKDNELNFRHDLSSSGHPA